MVWQEKVGDISFVSPSNYLKPDIATNLTEKHGTRLSRIGYRKARDQAVYACLTDAQNRTCLGGVRGDLWL